MAQFGVGPELAAQCPRMPTPDGWRPWTDADGPIPDPILKRVQALIDDVSLPLGATESYPLPGVTTLICLEPRVWARDAQGQLVQGCFRSAGVYLPLGTVDITPPTESKINKTINVLTVGSLLVGIAATLYSFGSSS